MATLAITHEPSPFMAECQLTFLQRQPLNFESLRRQHRNYCRLLNECGAEVRVLNASVDCADATFVEDTAVVLDEIAVLASMGVESRNREPAAMESVLREFRSIARIVSPGQLEGGDVLRVGRELIVGLSSRTNRDGVNQLRSIVERFGYRVHPVRVRGSLHLKTACTALPDGALLVNRNWLDTSALAGRECLDVPADEPWAANVALVNATVVVAGGNPQTADLLVSRGLTVRTAEVSEFAKAEGGVTCLSLLFET
ncbi:MAG: arginine deiminase family protein [Planctomycetaceae bacterium]